MSCPSNFPKRTESEGTTGQVMRTPVWGWSLPGPAATTSPSVGRSFDCGSVGNDDVGWRCW